MEYLHGCVSRRKNHVCAIKDSKNKKKATRGRYMEWPARLCKPTQKPCMRH
jgi:hypothetical protein